MAPFVFLLSIAALVGLVIVLGIPRVVPVSGTLSQFPAGTYPTHNDQIGWGGLRVVADHPSRDAIPTFQCRLGMIVICQSDAQGIAWQLTTYPPTGSDGDWTQISLTGGGITALTGDVTASGPGSVAATLATVNSNTGSFGSSTAIPSFTVNAKGLMTAASTNAVIAPAGTLSGTTLNSTVVTSSLTAVGTITSGTWTGTTIAIANGGTGQTTQTAAFDALSPLTTLGDTLYFGASHNVRLAGNMTTTRLFLSQTGAGASSAAPIWVQPAFTDISGSVAAGQMPALAGDVTTSAGAVATTIKTSVALAGSPTTTTQTALDDSTKIATTAYVDSAVAAAATTVITPSHGGTGLTTLTAHAVVLGEGTADVGFATIGTAGRLLVDQGTFADPVFATTGIRIDSHSGTITTDTESSNAVLSDVSVSDWHLIVLNGNITTFTLSNAVIGQQFTFVIQQAASGGPYSITNWWPGTIIWMGSPYSAPSMPVTASAYLTATFKCIGSGVYLAWWLGNSAA